MSFIQEVLAWGAHLETPAGLGLGCAGGGQGGHLPIPLLPGAEGCQGRVPLCLTSGARVHYGAV